MSKKQDLLDLLDKTAPVYRLAQMKMIAAREAKEVAEWEHKRAENAAYLRSDGKNAEQRKALVQMDYDVEQAWANLVKAEREFNMAYANYKEHEAVVLYIRDATALLGLDD